MNERNLLGERHSYPKLQPEQDGVSLLQHLQKMEQLVQEQRDFLRRQEAKARAAEEQDANDARAVRLHLEVWA